MNKKIVFGMIALLSVSLFFLGCPTEADSDDSPSSSSWPVEDGSPKPPNPQAAAENLKSALLRNSSGSAQIAVSPDGTTIIVFGGTLTFDGSTAIPAGVTLNVTDNATLNVTGTVTVDSGAKININSGSGVEVASGGVLDIKDGADGELDGTITVKAGGTSYDRKDGGASLFGSPGASTGSFVYEAGAVAIVGTSTPTIRVGNTDYTSTVKLTSGTFTVKETGYELDGDAIVRSVLGIRYAEFKMKGTSRLTVDIKWGSLAGGLPYGVYVFNNAKIVGEPGTVIEVKTPTPPFGEEVDGTQILTEGLIYIDTSDGENFYDSGSTAKLPNTASVFNNGDTIVPVATYNWTADAGGSGVAGWKKQP
jgi:hypothetical protein